MATGVQVTRRDLNPLVVLDLRGAVTGSAYEVLTGVYHSACQEGARDVLLNFARVEHLDSAGIAVVIGILTDARQHDRRVLVTGLTPHYRKIFDLMGLPQFAPVFDTEEAAQRNGQNASGPRTTSHFARALAGGVSIGLSASGVFVPLVARPALSSATNDAVATAAVVIVIGAATTGGVWFAQVVASGRGETASRKTAAIVGVVFALAGAAGLFSTFSIASFVGRTFAHRELSDLEAFRAAFVSASGLIALVCTLAASRAFGFAWRGGLATAFLVAGVTATTYLLFALAVDSILGLHVGRGDLAMPKAAALCNFFAGLVGGSMAFERFVRARR